MISINKANLHTHRRSLYKNETYLLCVCARGFNCKPTFRFRCATKNKKKKKKNKIREEKNINIGYE